MFEKELASIPNKRLRATQNEFPFREVLLFGAGGRGRSVARFFARRGIKVLKFFDNNQALHGKIIEGVECLPPSEIRRFPDTPLLVASHKFMDIVVSLLAMGVGNIYPDFQVTARWFEPDLLEIHGEEIGRVHDSLADEASRRSYLSIVKSVLTGEDGFLEISPFRRYYHPATLGAPGDAVVDGGAYTGGTAHEFALQCGKDCHIWAFEPFHDSYRQLAAYLWDHGLERLVTPVRKALWSEAGELRFMKHLDTDEANCIDEQGEIRVPTVDLDGYLVPATRIDLIKLDVEGSELEALKGSERTIRAHRPKLQICLYHKLEDLWTIPEYIESLDLGYTLHLGHSNPVMLDTVLYASPGDARARA